MKSPSFSQQAPLPLAGAYGVFFPSLHYSCTDSTGLGSLSCPTFRVLARASSLCCFFPPNTSLGVSGWLIRFPGEVVGSFSLRSETRRRRQDRAALRSFFSFFFLAAEDLELVLSSRSRRPGRILEVGQVPFSRDFFSGLDCPPPLPHRFKGFPDPFAPSL